MKDFEEFFRGKKVTVMGLGLLGRGVGDAQYIAEAGAAEVIVTDLKDEAALADSVAALDGYDNIVFHLGEHRDEDFIDRDLVLVAAGVPADSQYIAIAREQSGDVTQSAVLFAELSGLPIIGVTGTRGKSTVTMMIHHTLEFITGEKILLGGNIRGVSNLQLLNEVQPDSLCVMELDSWQLQGWGWRQQSPQIAVFTSFMEDHLNYYQREGMSREEAMQRYFSDKANIFRYQNDSGVLVTTPDVFEWAKQMPGMDLGQEVVLVDASTIPEDAVLSMPGEHNRLNAALAYEALKAASLNDEEIYAGLASFPGVEGRLQLVKTTDTARIYNDNNATTPQAATAGLEALDTGQHNVILIAGGADKNIDLEDFAAAIKTHCKAVLLTPGNGTDRLVPMLVEAPATVEEVPHLRDAFARAVALSSPGDSILFSPAFASFAQYKNEYERNDEFLSLVAALDETAS